MTEVDSKSQAPLLSSDVHTAFRNAFQLGGSLIATWGVALLVRLYLPRYLGPHAFGLYSFADSFALTGVGLLSLGLVPYIQKEIPLRPAHASEFFGGILALRLMLAVVVLAGLQGLLWLGGRPPETHALVLIFGVAYFLVIDNSNLAALLQALRTVGGLALTNIAAKVLWAVLLGIAMWRGASVEWLAAGFVASEAVKTLVLTRIVRRKMDLRLRVDLKAALAVVIASLPFYTNAVALSLNRLDITVLTFMSHESSQVGWYGATVNLAGLTLMLSPLLTAVLLPLLARAHARSPEELWLVVRRTAEGLIVVALPMALFAALGADLWVRIAFGEAFAPAAVSLRAIAPQFFFTYLATLFSMVMVVLGRGWRLTAVSIAGMLLNPLVGFLLIPYGDRLLGRGGAGAGAAVGVVVMDVFVAGWLLRDLGPAALDRRTLRVAFGALAAALGVIGLHLALEPWGPWRLLADVPAYLALAALFGALPVRRLLALVADVRRQRDVSAVSAAPE